jgi:predicted nucleic acid-binding protein
LIVVSDTSPFVALAAVGQLELLPQLFGQVLLPQAVHEEILAGGEGAAGVAEAMSAAWVRVRASTEVSLVESLSEELDDGEAEAIALALECGADLLLIDEHRGCAIAGRFGIRVAGVLGVLIEAKARGMLPMVTPVLDALISMAGFRVSDALYRRVIEAAGE